MDKNTPLISIIVPVYNVEKYLEKCVDSIINQTYKNIEIILVDDGSRDSSGKLCDRYSAIDSRIVVLHKQNEGLSMTRNRGVEIANGDYVMFVDSDDWLDEEICETLLNAITHYGVESAMCTYVREYPEKSIPKLLDIDGKSFSSQEFRRRLCGPVGNELKTPENLDVHSTVWGKIYPASAVKKHSFVDTKEIGTEDMLYNFSLFADVHNIVYINKPMYHYRKSVNTSLTATYKLRLAEQWSILYSKVVEIIERERMSDDFYTALNNRIAINMIGLGLNCVQDSARNLEKYRRIKKLFENEDRKKALKQLTVKDMPLHWRVFFILAKCRSSLLLTFMLITIEKLKGKI